MSRFSFFICATMLYALPLRAETVSCRPGELHSAVGAPASVTELVLTGSADASDFFFIGSEMTSLRLLDISGLTIEAYHGPRLGTSSSWPAATIPDGALAGTAIEAIFFPTAQTAIGCSAFTSTALKQLVIPESVTHVGENAFADCRCLTSARIASARLGGYTFRGCDALEEVELDGCRTLDRADFAGCTSLASVKGSEEIGIIGDRAFEGCRSLKSFRFGKSLEVLGERAFALSGLESVTVPDGAPLDSIGPWAFADCCSLVRVELPQSVTAMARGAFFGCTALKSIALPGTETGDFILKGASALESVTLSGRTEYISPYTFFGASAVTSLTLPSGIDRLGDYAMAEMSRLKTVDASALSAVPTLGKDVFEGIDQPETTLRTDDRLTDSFRNAAQWQNFRIEGLSAIRDVHDAAGAPVVRGRIADNRLEVEATGTTLSSIELYDTAGQLLLSLKPRSESADTDISSLSASILIVLCITASGDRVSLKLAR